VFEQASPVYQVVFAGAFVVEEAAFVVKRMKSE
jgi:hypothetical protein